VQSAALKQLPRLLLSDDRIRAFLAREWSPREILANRSHFVAIELNLLTFPGSIL
jgi:hypothetical protein